MSKEIGSLGLTIHTRRVCLIKLVGDEEVHMTSYAARLLAEALEKGPDAVEAIAFILRQSADAIDALLNQDGNALETWCETQPERP